MRYVSRQQLLTMAQTIIQQPEFKIPESHFANEHMLTAVSCIVLMSFVMIQLIDLRIARHLKCPIISVLKNKKSVNFC